ncbi:MAG: hypothetical protein AABX25_01725 [Nanoarchaeota archaeon]
MGKSIRSGDQGSLTINKGRLGSLNIYEITEDELEKLETGGSEPIFLNFAIFALSVALSFLITLLTTKIDSQKLLTLFFVITVLGFFSCAILFIIWWRSRRSINNLVKKIKERIKQNV